MICATSCWSSSRPSCGPWSSSPAPSPSGYGWLSIRRAWLNPPRRRACRTSRSLFTPFTARNGPSARSFARAAGGNGSSVHLGSRGLSHAPISAGAGSRKTASTGPSNRTGDAQAWERHLPGLGRIAIRIVSGSGSPSTGATHSPRPYRSSRVCAAPTRRTDHRRGRDVDRSRGTPARPGIRNGRAI